MIITLKDGTNFYASTEEANRIQDAAQDAAVRQIDLRKLNIGIKAVAPWDIKRIQTGGEPPLDRSTLIAAKHQLTDAEAEAKAKHNKERAEKARKAVMESIKGF